LLSSISFLPPVLDDPDVPERLPSSFRRTDN
jgi:hypothetical protein